MCAYSPGQLPAKLSPERRRFSASRFSRKRIELNEVVERLDDYFQMGVPVCWVIDPVKGRGWIATPGQLSEPSDCIQRAGDIEMPLSAVVENPA
jgi:hypothetical protein